MYSDMTVTGEARRETERGRGETQPGQWVGACFQKKCRRPSEAICDEVVFFICVLLVGFSATIWAAVDFFFSAFFFWWSLDEWEREREREKNGWIASESDDGRQVNRSFPFWWVFFSRFFFIFLLTKSV